MDYQAEIRNLLEDEYTPHPWLLNKHLMTMANSFFSRSLERANVNNEQLLIPVDAQSVVLAQGHFQANNTRCLIIVHGLEGSSASPYVLSLTEAALAQGYNVVRLNLRNCGNTLHFTPTLYNAGQSNDLLCVAKWLAEHKGQSEQFFIGYSLGGNLVLKAVAELDGHSFVKGACTVSPSIDLAASVDCLERGINRIYDYYFLYSLRKKIVLKHKLFPKRYDLKKLGYVNSLRAFDNLFTAPDAGYADAAQYYQAASALPLINKIKTPTLIITAQNDPLVPFSSFSTIDSAYIWLIAPEHGGHVSFLSRGQVSSNGKPNLFWTDMQILSFCLKQCPP